MSFFKSIRERAVLEKKGRLEDAKNLLPFGVPFIDATLGGIMPTDLILIGAEPGVGKTELTVDIALYNAKRKKRVHFFALEAYENEMETRMKYKILVDLYRAAGGKKETNYQDWYLGKCKELDPYEDQAIEELSACEHMYTYYRDNHFDLAKFSKIFATLEGKSDLVVIDHIHYFDFTGDKENKAIADIMKTIKDMSQLMKIPVVLVAHIRKIAKADKSIIPSLDDFHGTSELGKIATRAVMLSPGGLDEKLMMPITYMQAVKNRLGAERRRVLARMVYDTQLNAYRKEVQYGMLSADGKKFVPFTNNRPSWLKIS